MLLLLHDMNKLYASLRTTYWMVRLWKPFRKRVPVLQQLSAVECGAACLAMLLNYHGRDTAIAEVRDTCSLGRDGLSGLTIVKAARGFGLRVRAYSIDVDQLKYLSLPAIIHWGFNHFVVLDSLTAGGVEIVDPARGRVRLTVEEFRQDFTGVIFTFEPGNQFLDGTEKKNVFSIWNYLSSMFSGRSAKGTLAQILLASLLLQICGLAVPIFTKVLIDQVVPFRNSDLLLLYG